MNGTSGFHEVRSLSPDHLHIGCCANNGVNLETGAWDFRDTHDHIGLSSGISTTREKTAGSAVRSPSLLNLGNMRVRFLLIIFLFLNAIFLSTNSAAIDPPKITLEMLEVTQGIQDEHNNAPLIADRNTVVRAFFRLDSGTDLTVKGRLVITDPNNTHTETQVEKVGLKASGAEGLTGRRLDMAASLNFAIPSSSIKEGIFSFQVGQNLTTENGEEIICTNCDTPTEPIHFSPPTTLRLQLVNFTYTKDGILRKPRTIDNELIKSWLLRAYPIAHLNVSETEVTLENQESFFIQKDCNIPTIHLDKIRMDDINTRGVHILTRYIGLVADGGLFMKGCAITTSGVANAAIPAAVPTGPQFPDREREKDDSYGDWYVGHELSHTFGLFHVNACDTEEPYDPSSAMPGGLIKGEDGGYVGLDMGNPFFTSEGKLPMAILDGNKYHDVRSYCEYLWLGMPTYQRILCQLYKEDGVSGVPFCQTPGTGQLAPSIFLASLADHFPVPVRTIYERLQLVEARDPKTLGKAKLEIRIDKKPLEESSFVSEYPSEQLLAILANIEYDKATRKRTGKILYSQKVSRAMKEPDASKGKVALRFLDEEDKPIGEDIPVAFEERPGTKDGRSVGRVRDAVLLPPKTKTTNAVEIVWIESGQVLDSRKVSKTPPTLNESGISVKKTPIDKAYLLGIDWIPAQVADFIRNEDVTYTVRISADNGTTWKTVAVGYKPDKDMLDSGKITFTVTDSKIKELNLETVSELKVKIVANDGFNSHEAIVQVDLSKLKFSNLNLSTGPG